MADDDGRDVDDDMFHDAAAAADAAEPKHDERQVRVQFVTKFEEYRVTDVPIALPRRLNRYGLSEVVNHLLSLVPPVPFEFVVEGQLLRSTLRKQIRQQGLSEEVVLKLEYQPATKPPSAAGDVPHPDWIAAVAGTDTHFVTACYDGVVRVYGTESHECVASVGAHKKPAVAVDIAEHGPVVQVATGSHDCTVRLYSLPSETAAAAAATDLELQATGVGHEGAVQSVSFAPGGHILCSGAWDGSVKLWSAGSASGGGGGGGAGGSDDGGDTAAPLKRRRRRGSSVGAGDETAAAPAPHRDASVTELACLMDLTGATQSVTAVGWLGDARAVVGGYDHTLRVYDVEAGGSLLSAMAGNKVITSLAAPASGAVVATGHPDNAIRVWDQRVGEAVLRTTMTSHTAWVADVAWAPASPFHLASASHDGTARMWDMRSPSALYTLGEHDDKALCVAYAGESLVVSGGADRKARMYAQAGRGGDGGGDGEESS